MVDAQRPWKGPILDNHFHLNRNGRYLDAAKDFKNVGGTHLVLVHCPDFSCNCIKMIPIIIAVRNYFVLNLL